MGDGEILIHSRAGPTPSRGAVAFAGRISSLRVILPQPAAEGLFRRAEPRGCRGFASGPPLNPSRPGSPQYPVSFQSIIRRKAPLHQGRLEPLARRPVPLAGGADLNAT